MNERQRKQLNASLKRRKARRKRELAVWINQFDGKFTAEERADYDKMMQIQRIVEGTTCQNIVFLAISLEWLRLNSAGSEDSFVQAFTAMSEEHQGYIVGAMEAVKIIHETAPELSDALASLHREGLLFMETQDDAEIMGETSARYGRTPEQANERLKAVLDMVA